MSKKMPILLQCNAGDDPNKFGFKDSQMHEAIECALKMSHLRVDGVMTIAPLDEDAESTKR